VPNRIIMATAMAIALCSGAFAASGSTYSPGQIESAASQQYRLGPGDRIKIFVFGLDPINSEYTIGDDGTITLPFVQTIAVSGRTLTDVQQDIQAKLATQQILRNPVVNVQHVVLRPFYIMGEVQKPGEYAFRAGTTVMSAVAIAGGFTYRASKSKVQITRSINGRPITASAGQNDMVQPGDRITVRERWF
jgi:protein involved in polysaccharide export with SLBB domain